MARKLTAARGDKLVGISKIEWRNKQVFKQFMAWQLKNKYGTNICSAEHKSCSAEQMICSAEQIICSAEQILTFWGSGNRFPLIFLSFFRFGAEQIGTINLFRGTTCLFRGTTFVFRGTTFLFRGTSLCSVFFCQLPRHELFENLFFSAFNF